jgi:hypothetical protein
MVGNAGGHLVGNTRDDMEGVPWPTMEQIVAAAKIDNKLFEHSRATHQEIVTVCGEPVPVVVNVNTPAALTDADASFAPVRVQARFDGNPTT